MPRIPFLQERREAGSPPGRRPARDFRPVTETLAWTGASFFLGYVALAAALGIVAP